MSDSFRSIRSGLLLATPRNKQRCQIPRSYHHVSSFSDDFIRAPLVYLSTMYVLR